jgi:hypothetical protein
MAIGAAVGDGVCGTELRPKRKNAPAFKPGRFIYSYSFPEIRVQEARCFSSSVFC